MFIDALLIVGAYLLGSVASAIVVCRLMGLPDPRALGSGNPGATNVLRTGSKKAAAVTLLGDLVKGLIPMLIAHALAASDMILAGVGLAAFLGHLYPVFFGFRGGKGVATALGVLIGMHWIIGLLCAATWLASAAITRISSLSALVTALLAPAYAYGVTGSPWLTGATLLMSVLIYWRHRSNIRNLLDGTEGRLKSK